MENAFENRSTAIPDKSKPELPVIRRDIALVPPARAAEKARQFYEQARMGALEQVRALQEALTTSLEMSVAILEGGDVYPVGVAELARSLSEDLRWKTKTLEAVVDREFSAAERNRQEH